MYLLFINKRNLFTGRVAWAEPNKYFWFHGLLEFFVCLFVCHATTCPCGLHGPPSWASQVCNHVLQIGRSLVRSQQIIDIKSF